MLSGVGCRLFSGVALIHIRKLHFFSRDFLHSLGQFSHLRPVLLIGRCHFQRQQMSQGIDGGMDSLEPLRFLCPSKPARAPLSGRRLHRATIHNHGGRIRISILYHAKNSPQIVSHRLKASRPQPPLRLLLHDPPRREFMGHHPPGTPRPHQPTQCVEHPPQAMRPLRLRFFHQRQVRSAKLPLFIAHITRIRFPLCRHPKLNAGMYLLLHPFLSKKLMTGS